MRKKMAVAIILGMVMLMSLNALALETPLGISFLRNKFNVVPGMVIELPISFDSQEESIVSIEVIENNLGEGNLAVEKEKVSVNTPKKLGGLDRFVNDEKLKVLFKIPEDVKVGDEKTVIIEFVPNKDIKYSGYKVVSAARIKFSFKIVELGKEDSDNAFIQYVTNYEKFKEAKLLSVIKQEDVSLLQEKIQEKELMNKTENLKVCDDKEVFCDRSGIQLLLFSLVRPDFIFRKPFDGLINSGLIFIIAAILSISFFISRKRNKLINNDDELMTESSINKANNVIGGWE